MRFASNMNLKKYWNHCLKGAEQYWRQEEEAWRGGEQEDQRGEGRLRPATHQEGYKGEEVELCVFIFFKHIFPSLYICLDIFGNIFIISSRLVLLSFG